MLAAKTAGLRYVDDRMPGIRRKRSGSAFGYYAADGARIKDEAELARIRKLAVPPAYRDVWICPLPSGHIQATGRDARGRKQCTLEESGEVNLPKGRRIGGLSTLEARVLSFLATVEVKAGKRLSN